MNLYKYLQLRALRRKYLAKGMTLEEMRKIEKEMGLWS